MDTTKEKMEKGRFVLLCAFMYFLIVYYAVPCQHFRLDKGIEWIFAGIIVLTSIIAPVFKAWKWRNLSYVVGFIYSVLLGWVAIALFVVFAGLLYATVRHSKAIYDMIHKLWIPGL